MISGRILKDAQMGTANVGGQAIPVCRFTMVLPHYTKRGQKNLYTRVTLWRNYAVRMQPHLVAGRCVNVGGFATPGSYTNDGETRSYMEISNADFVDFIDLPPKGQINPAIDPTDTADVEGVTIPPEDDPFPED